jgi:hypothetical protein
MPPGGPNHSVRLVMHPRRIEEADVRLRELRHEEWEDAGLAALALGLAVAATEVRPALAIPLLAAGLAGTVLAVRAFWRRWELLDRLVVEQDAYAIPDVRLRAEQVESMTNRRAQAASIRDTLKAPGLALGERVVAAADELESLVWELDDEELAMQRRSRPTASRSMKRWRHMTPSPMPRVRARSRSSSKPSPARQALMEREEVEVGA